MSKNELKPNGDMLKISNIKTNQLICSGKGNSSKTGGHIMSMSNYKGRERAMITILVPLDGVLIDIWKDKAKNRLLFIHALSACGSYEKVSPYDMVVLKIGDETSYKPYATVPLWSLLHERVPLMYSIPITMPDSSPPRINKVLLTVQRYSNIHDNKIPIDVTKRFRKHVVYLWCSESRDVV